MRAKPRLAGWRSSTLLALAATPHVLAAALDLDGEWLLPLEEFGGAEVAAHADGVVRTIAATKQAQDLALRYGLVLLPVAALVTTVVLSALLREAVESQAAQSESGRLLESLLVHTGTRPPSRVPKTASGRLEALQELQAKTLREDATRQALLAGMEDGDTSVVVFEGTVEVRDTAGVGEPVRVHAGESTRIRRGKATAAPHPHGLSTGDWDRGRDVGWANRGSMDSSQQPAGAQGQMSGGSKGSSSQGGGGSKKHGG